MKKYKPTSKLKILKPVWWNPLFWLGIIITPFIGGIIGFFDTASELWGGLKEWGFKRIQHFLIIISRFL